MGLPGSRKASPCPLLSLLLLPVPPGLPQGQGRERRVLFRAHSHGLPPLQQRVDIVHRVLLQPPSWGPGLLPPPPILEVDPTASARCLARARVLLLQSSILLLLFFFPLLLAACLLRPLLDRVRHGEESIERCFLGANVFNPPLEFFFLLEDKRFYSSLDSIIPRGHMGAARGGRDEGALDRPQPLRQLPIYRSLLFQLLL
mmetsp:Transcript_24668/g.80855  ORF Transcript_24668/g.80855 Transcript_24668/m.80855 type:complete len:201 (-) Transcript_24668:465-1067(-)